MKISVFETYVRRKDGGLMHFDIIVRTHTSEDAVRAFGREYLKTKGQEGQQLTERDCLFCHMEEASPEIESHIKSDGYYILELQGCSQ